MNATPAPALETDRLRLRGPEPRDLEPFIAFFTSDRAAASGNLFDRPGAWRLFAATIGHWHLRGFGPWTVTLKPADDPIGLVGCLRFDDWPENEIVWFLWEGVEGQGYATEAARAARRQAYRGYGWRTAVSYIAPTNARSIRVAERLGARPDPGAPHPGTGPQIVYRHPAPEAA